MEDKQVYKCVFYEIEGNLKYQYLGEQEITKVIYEPGMKFSKEVKFIKDDDRFIEIDEENCTYAVSLKLTSSEIINGYKNR